MNPSKWLADRQLNFLVGVNLLVVIVATALSHGQFVDIDNLQSMGSQLPELGLLALGIMLSMVSGNGGIDLSGVRSRTSRAWWPRNCCPCSFPPITPRRSTPPCSA
jgi:ribose/xylose/arabinose/galactoside ABC-type transport system permease subunit